MLTREQQTGGSSETTWLLKVNNIKSFDVSSLRLRADDLRVVGDILAEGSALHELNLSNNLDFSKASLVAPDEISLAKRDTLFLHNQTFRNYHSFGIIPIVSPPQPPSKPQVIINAGQ